MTTDAIETKETGDETIELSVRREPRLSPDSPFVYHPRYANPEKTRLRAIVRLPDGRFTEMEADRADTRSPLVRDIFAQYTEDEILLFTRRQASTVAKFREMEARVAEDKRLTAEREAVFQAKAEALKIPEVSDPSQKEIRRRIRRASSPTEVAALAAMALLEAKGAGPSA